jgi:sulfatase maturation enzyme AslB (radical SAM superfamily)
MIQLSSDRGDMKAVFWALTEYCENSCHYCAAKEFMLSTKKGKNVLSIDQSQLELDDYIAKSLPSLIGKGDVLFFGGEPTLHPKCITYINQMCQDTLHNTDFNVILITHGDIDEDKILSINTHGKNEFYVSISYHFYQAKFDSWLEKVKLFHKHLKKNIIISAVMPRSPKVWDKFEENIRKVLELNIPVELKPEFDDKTNNPDPLSLDRFADLNTTAKETITDNLRYLTKLTFTQDNNVFEMPYNNHIGSIPISPSKSLCENRSFFILGDMIGFSCGQGKTTTFKVNDYNSLESFINNNKFMCKQSTCTDSRRCPPVISVLDKELSDYNEFFDFWKDR